MKAPMTAPRKDKTIEPAKRRSRSGFKDIGADPKSCARLDYEEALADIVIRASCLCRSAL
ncbi:MAG: hypothetical protein QNJ09_05640 [Paracoccaceae bacterium]|nr:hypothetical protein [Paracoccaceae bacterium]